MSEHEQKTKTKAAQKKPGISQGAKSASKTAKTVASKLPLKKWWFWVLIVFALLMISDAIGDARSIPQEYSPLREVDVNGMTIAEACTALREAGWHVDAITNYDSPKDKSTCSDTGNKAYKASYGKEKYWTRSRTLRDDYETVDIYYTDGKTEEQKKLSCEAEGKWWRDKQCKSQEEWENEYAWNNAHAACKRYGANGYAKTLTDCYVGNDYKGPVDGEDSSGSETSETSTTNSAKSNNTDTNVMYELKTINDGEECPSNVKYCFVKGQSSGYTSYGWGTFRGRITNNTGRDLSYIQFSVGVYDSSGAKAGTCYDNMTNLKSGASWAIEAYCSAWPSGLKFNDPDITAW